MNVAPKMHSKRQKSKSKLDLIPEAFQKEQNKRSLFRYDYVCAVYVPVLVLQLSSTQTHDYLTVAPTPL